MTLLMSKLQYRILKTYYNIMQTNTIERRQVNHFAFDQPYFNKSGNDSFSDVSKQVIDELLCLYPQNNRIIKNCKYLKGKLVANLVDKEIAYSIAKPNYFTAEQMVLAVSQMGYLLGGLIIKDDNYCNVDSSFYKLFLVKISNLECYYTRLNMKFKKKIIKGNDNLIEMSVNKVDYYPIKKWIVVEMTLRIGESFFAETQLITI